MTNNKPKIKRDGDIPAVDAARVASQQLLRDADAVVMCDERGTDDAERCP